MQTEDVKKLDTTVANEINYFYLLLFVDSYSLHKHGRIFQEIMMYIQGVIKLPVQTHMSDSTK